MAITAHADPFAGKKILFIDSYHEGYEWSDGMIKGVKSVLDGTGAELRVVHMNGKSDPTEESIRRVGLRVKDIVDTYRPDVVIAADDAASRHVVMPYYKDARLSVVFCGVNWDASIYGYPYTNATGMLEVDLTEQLVELLRRYARGNRVGFLAPDVFTHRKVARIYQERFFSGTLTVQLEKTLDRFKEAFLRAQNEVDSLYVYDNAGLDRWDRAELEDFMIGNTRIPTGTHSPWMAPYVMITLSRVPEEQGVWSARTALRILDGVRPSDIPVVVNREAKLTINMKIANKLGIVFEPALLETAEIIGLEASR